MKGLRGKWCPRIVGCMALVLCLAVINFLPYILTRELRERYGNLSEVQAELEAHVPDGTALQELRAYLESASWECSEVVDEVVGDRVIYCSGPGPSPNFFTTRKWLLRFEIMDGILISSTAREGFISP